MKHMPEKTNDHRGCLACGFPFWDDLTPDEQDMLCRYKIGRASCRERV